MRRHPLWRSLCIGSTLLLTASGGALPQTTPVVELEAELLEMVNAEREAWGLDPLRHVASLSRVARAHSERMAEERVVSHELDGRSMEERIRSVAPDSCLFGENLAKNVSVDYAFSDLMESEGHRANLLHPDYSQVGIGIANGEDGFLYVTQNFMSPCRKRQRDPPNVRLSLPNTSGDSRR